MKLRGPVNAFSNEFLQAYSKLFDSLVEDGYDVRAVVLSSAFPKIFTAGLDRELSDRPISIVQLITQHSYQLVCST